MVILKHAKTIPNNAGLIFLKVINSGYLQYPPKKLSLIVFYML